MKKYLALMATIAAALFICAGCKDQVPEVPKVPTAGRPDVAELATGKVLETMNAAEYTYVHVDTGNSKIWAAAPMFKVKVGDKVIVPQGAPMKDYHSKTLNRTFDLVYFVSNIILGGSDLVSAQPSGKPAATSGSRTKVSAPADMDFSGIQKPQGGKTVAELYAEKESLAGKEVIMRGKVIKFTPQVMGKNWIHLQDGTGEDGSNDLTITTNTTAKAGDTVLVSGVVSTKKDFGFGYKYDVIIEDAAIKVE